ncbi:MAG TPA: 50S ribosomal protein L25 [Anaerolineaceae bacterium]|nr:50S ribosomal protein L25 [Anaerolineaceae bacterium]
MEKAVIHATHRTVIGKQVGALRREGKLPAVMYGHHIDSTPITLDLRDATRILSGLTSSSLVTIELDGKEHAALIREKQRDYIRGTLKHVDFQILSLTEKLRTTVSIELTGLAPAVKDFNGVVVTGVNELEVECLPQDLPERIIVDISNLNKIGDGLYIRDIKLSDKISILEDQDEMVVLITAPAAEEVVEEVAVPGAEEPEVIEHGKKEEEEEASES